MAYQVYFANLTDEIQAMTFMLLRVKSEAGELEPGEQELLEKMQENLDQLPPPELVQHSHPSEHRGPPRRRFSNGRSHSTNHH
jgi:hypothetical protein